MFGILKIFGASIQNYEMSKCARFVTSSGASLIFILASSHPLTKRLCPSQFFFQNVGVMYVILTMVHSVTFRLYVVITCFQPKLYSKVYFCFAFRIKVKSLLQYFLTAFIFYCIYQYDKGVYVFFVVVVVSFRQSGFSVQVLTCLLHLFALFYLQICDNWMKKVEELSSSALLPETCFNYLMEAMIEFIYEPSCADIKAYLGKLIIFLQKTCLLFSVNYFRKKFHHSYLTGSLINFCLGLTL